MKSLKCPNCGGPIELADDEVRTACPYCGASLERTIAMPVHGGPDGAAARIDVRGAVRTTRQVLGCTLVVVLGILAIGGVIAWRAAQIGREVAESVAEAARHGVADARRVAQEPLPLDRLSAATFSGRHRIAAAPPAGGLAAFEPAGNLSWALAIAQRWAADAQLMRIDVDRLRPDGTVNVADDPHAEVTYRFASPRRFAAFRDRANADPEAKGDYEFWVEIERGEILAYGLSTLAQIARLHVEQIERLDFPKSLTLPEILEKNRRRPELPGVPYFNAYLIRIDGEGWSWYLSTLSGQPDIPRIRARDGRMWPF